MNEQDFIDTVWQQGNRLFRDMPWRTDTQPYYVLVSELMLQQTQVDRVIPKFTEFIQRFPTINALASASLADVLAAWSGLGYNRRAKFLHLAARVVQDEHAGAIPDTYDQLVALPGIGPNTAGALLAYGFNHPSVFIETNVRTVYFYHFFPDHSTVTDKELRELVAQTVDHEHPREWYWALMDYGSSLKKQGFSANSKSAHYKKQSALKGSLREVRGMIIREVSQRPLPYDTLKAIVPADERFERAFADLIAEGMIRQSGSTVSIA